MNSIPVNQIVIFSLEAIIVAMLVLSMFRIRSLFGFSPLYVMLGVFQPIQVLLASSLYVELFPGIIVSPGTVIMFTATLFAVLLVYILGDAIETRRVIYGVMLANITVTLLLFIFGLELEMPDTLNFLELPRELFYQNARVMFSGTIVLFADVILIIVLYEMIYRWIKKSLFLRIYLTIGVVLVFDSLVFYTGAFYGQVNYSSILISGIVGKLVMAVFFAVASTVYFRFFEPLKYSSESLQDVFYALTYRQKYEIERQKGIQMEEALEISEANYREIFNMVNDAIFVHDTETADILSVNPKVCDLWGYTPAEISWLNVEALSSEEPSFTQVEVLEIIRKASAGTSQLYEWCGKKKNGELFWVEVNPRLAKIGGKDRVLAVARDITERKRMSEELQESHDRLEERVKARTAELSAALGQVKTLSGLLPICSSCKKIRDDKGYWHQVEIYVRDRTDAEFSHGICPDCMRKLYPEFYHQIERERQAIIEAIAKLGEATPDDIALTVGHPLSNTLNRLQAMVGEKQVEEVELDGRLYYRLPQE